MNELFQWNELADQPHNILPRHERLRAHWRHAGSYLALLGANLWSVLPVLHHYRKWKKKVYRQSVSLEQTMGLAVSPLENGEEELLAGLQETGVRNVLVRVPSWEKEKIDKYTNFIAQLAEGGWEVLVVLLQNRYDVLEPQRWADFLQEVMEKLSPWVKYFEIGHAWNRTKWGLWSFQEYLSLARAAVALARPAKVNLVGPAVIDFEFHLYPVTLKQIPFDVVSTLLYVDRTGAPEQAQWGFTLEKKITLLRAIIESTPCRGRECWITEFNWPLQGMGPYSPAPGKPCVSEEDQANYLVRYFLICLTSGAIQRVYWWQLAAKGYGLVDPLVSPWRRRPSFLAFKTLIKFMEGSVFWGRVFHPEAWILLFRRSQQNFAVGWTKQGAIEYDFGFPVEAVWDRDGNRLPPSSPRIKLEPRPKYVFFQGSSF